MFSPVGVEAAAPDAVLVASTRRVGKAHQLAGPTAGRVRSCLRRSDPRTVLQLPLGSRAPRVGTDPRPLGLRAAPQPAAAGRRRAPRPGRGGVCPPSTAQAARPAVRPGVTDTGGTGRELAHGVRPCPCQGRTSNPPRRTRGLGPRAAAEAWAEAGETGQCCDGAVGART